MDNEIDSQISDASSIWQLWHIDTFDRDSPPSLQSEGTDIVQGLCELWLHTLKDGLLENGSASFSRFHLTWGNAASARVEIFVQPFNNPSLMKLRQWANPVPQIPNSEAEQDQALLLRLARLHHELLQKRNQRSASVMDWSAESRAILVRVEEGMGPAEL